MAESTLSPNIKNERETLKARLAEIDKLEAMAPELQADGDGKALVCCVGSKAAEVATEGMNRR